MPITTPRMMISGRVMYAALDDGLPVSSVSVLAATAAPAAAAPAPTAPGTPPPPPPAEAPPAGPPPPPPGSPGTTDEEPKLLFERYREPPPEDPWSFGGAASCRPACTGIWYWLACGVPGDGSPSWAAAAEGRSMSPTAARAMAHRDRAIVVARITCRIEPGNKPKRAARRRPGRRSPGRC